MQNFCKAYFSVATKIITTAVSSSQQMHRPNNSLKNSTKFPNHLIGKIYLFTRLSQRTVVNEFYKELMPQIFIKIFSDLKALKLGWLWDGQIKKNEEKTPYDLLDQKSMIKSEMPFWGLLPSNRLRNKILYATSKRSLLRLKISVMITFFC